MFLQGVASALERAAREMSSLETEAFKQKTLWEREQFMCQQAYHRSAHLHCMADTELLHSRYAIQWNLDSSQFDLHPCCSGFDKLIKLHTRLQVSDSLHCEVIYRLYASLCREIEAVQSESRNAMEENCRTMQQVRLCHPML